MTDVLLFHTPNNGDINLENGSIEMSPGLESAAYLSMFGGSDWWGDIDENIPARKYYSKTQEALDKLPPSSKNLRRIEEAALSDLDWFVSEGAATNVEVSASIPDVNKVSLLVNITADGDINTFEYSENWKQSA